jgi:hypothetical protein
MEVAFDEMQSGVCCCKLRMRETMVDGCIFVEDRCCCEGEE